GIRELKIDTYLAENRKTNHWYRYVEAQVWADPIEMRSRFTDWIEVEPESWTHNGVTHLQNFRDRKRSDLKESTAASRHS
ncbi:MAG: hypothetical protein AAF491_06890, partial [Verrucomicrobiota bacterium]